jgi:hypothetical protein
MFQHVPGGGGSPGGAGAGGGAIEKLGYGTIWIGGSPPAELSFVEPLWKRRPH